MDGRCETTAMNVPSIVMVAMNADVRAASLEAAQLAFPGVKALELPTIEEALNTTPPSAGPEFLLLFEPSPAAVKQAVTATDAAGFPRWVVVVFGSGAAGHPGVAAELPLADWQPRIVAQVLHAALRLHALARENGRLRGDMSTIGRRLSHDLRTPLAAIYTASEGLNEMTPEQTGDLAVFTRSIATSTGELMHLIERMSFILKASAEPGATENVPMSEVVFGSLQRVEARSLRQGAVITQPARWPAVAGVPSWLDAIWLNLVANALQHGGPKPQIELGWSETPGQLRFWVNDRGPGVAPEKAGKLFQPFHLMHRLNAPRGLGLSLVHRLVDLQGGTCGYEPRPGGGAHFFFTLPAAKTP